jgi:hypothetical protein
MVAVIVMVCAEADSGSPAAISAPAARRRIVVFIKVFPPL